MVSSPGFGSTPSDSTPYSDSLSLRLRLFAALTLPLRVTRWLILQEARHHTADSRKSLHSALTACKRTVSGSISLPEQGCFSPFPHGTCSLSVIKGI
jgi:hypothetical protein